ncbi:MAG: hypothetical protein AUK63_122 [bacterium P3]|nr:MAG: hypothetical protein AUK63_122 [bacterium P3]KWW42415.1 MAG: hypothetical protein F083_319 [bacterium F083]
MRKIFRLASLTLTVGILFAGCSIYHPQSVDIPLINHNGDTRVDASAALSWMVIPSTFTVNGTVTHGFNDWLSGQLHANYGGNNFYVQAAPGTYYPTGDHSVLEGYAGIGFGGAWSDEVESNSGSANSNSFAYNGTFLLPFAQANFGWHDLTKAHIDIAVGLKVGAYLPRFSYHELGDSGEILAGTDYDYTRTNLLLEPQMLLRIGGEHLKFNIRFGMAWLNDLLDEESNARNFYSDVVSASTGLTFFF